MFNTIPSPENKKERKISLAIEFSESQEVFPFPGINPEEYSRIKSAQEKFPGYSTPIDELLERFKNEGMKVVLGKYPKSGNVYILPAQSNDIENDCISPKQLQISGVTNEKLKELIITDKN